MPDQKNVQVKQRRLSRHYLTVLQKVDAYWHAGLAYGSVIFDQEWNQIKQGLQWATSQATLDKESAMLCSAYGKAINILIESGYDLDEQIKWLEAALTSAQLLGDTGSEITHRLNM